jgi:hypothetical protein
MVHRPLQRGEKPVVFSNVVGCDPEPAVQFLEDVAVGRLNRHTITGRAWVAAGATIDVRDYHQRSDG